jgi:hypothetical protein
MKLPNGERAIVDVNKITGYALNPMHPYGRHHARLFKRLLGIGIDDADRLIEALRYAAANEEAGVGQQSPFGAKYEVRFVMEGPRRSYTILSVWMIRNGETDPRLVTVYVEKP